MVNRATATAIFLGVGLGFAASLSAPVEASRNASGTYSLPAGNPVTAGNTITASWANTTLSDLGNEVTNSLDRNGKGAMLAPLECTDGTVSLPSITFDNDTDTGLYRAAANTPAMAAGGVKVQEWVSTGAVFPLAVTVAGQITVDGGVIVTQSTSNQTALVATGNGTGQGIRGVGGSTNGIGVSGVGSGTGAGGIFANGTASTAGTPQNAVSLSNGNLSLSGVTDPSSTTGFTDTVTPKNIVKAWGSFEANGTATPTLNDAFNVTSIAENTGTAVFTITFADDFPTGAYAVIMASNTAGLIPQVISKAGGSFTANVIIGSTGAVESSADLNTFNTVIDFIVLGAQ